MWNACYGVLVAGLQMAGDDMVSNAPRGTLGTIHNASLVLHELATGPALRQLTDVAERSDLSPATVHRLLRSLAAAGLVEQDHESSRYGLGGGLVDLADRYLSRHPVRAVAVPYLVDLRNTTGAGVLLGVRRGDRLVVLDQIDGGDAGGVYRDATRSRELMASPAGRLLAAHDDDAWDRLAPPSLRDQRDHWRRDLVVHDPDGSIDRPVCAATIHRDDNVVAAMQVEPVEPTVDAARALEPLVARAATTITIALGRAS